MRVPGSEAGVRPLAKRLLTALGVGKHARKSRERAALPAGADTRISQSLDEALDRVMADGAKRVLISGDRAFFDSVTARAPFTETHWVSCNAADLALGAGNPDQADFSSFDAVLCGGGEAALSYRHAIARMAEISAPSPVHWVGDNWEFCGGTLPVPSEAADAEALLFNHFQHYFGIKDPLQFRIEIYHGGERKHFYRILQPNQSVLIRLSEHYPIRQKAACIAVFVSHPILTRGRHYRLRVCADVFWRDSFATVHGAHEFKRSPDHKFEFRASKKLVRAGEIFLTIPNYARDLGENRIVTVVSNDATPDTIERDPEAFLDEVRVQQAESTGPFFGWKYRGYGGSFWYSLEDQQACANGHRGSISANHHVSVPIAERNDWSASPEELAASAKLREAGFMVDPFPVPVSPENEPLRYGIDFDSSNPQINEFSIFLFGANGSYLGEMPYRKRERGPFFPSEIIKDWRGGEPVNVRLAVVTPDWQAVKLRRKGLKLQVDMVVEDRHTGDRDITEFQNCWRNCGVIVPGMAAFGGPGAAVFGRTNLSARVRKDSLFRTSILSVNGSGNLAYRRTAQVEVTAYNVRGENRSVHFSIPAFGWRLDWIDDLIPELENHLGSVGVGGLLVTSKNADINCQVVTRSSKGAVSVQHMWGY